MSILEDLRQRTSDFRAAAKLDSQKRLLQNDERERADQAAADAAAREAAKPSIDAVTAAISAAALKGASSADVYRIPAAECRALPVQALDRTNARAFIGITRGLALWALEEQLRFEIVDRDNGKWTWRDHDKAKGIFHGFKDKQEGYEEWLALSISWAHEPVTEASKRRTEQRDQSKKVGFAQLLDYLTLRIRELAAAPGVTADQRADIEHHIRWQKKISKDDVESSAIAIVAAANALGIKLEDELRK